MNGNNTCKKRRNTWKIYDWKIYEMDEKAIVNATIKWINTIPISRARKRHAGSNLKGEPDITGTILGHRLELEAKAPGKKPTQIQLYRLYEWQMANACTGWFTSLQEAQDIVSNYLLRNHMSFKAACIKPTDDIHVLEIRNFLITTMDLNLGDTIIQAQVRPDQAYPDPYSHYLLQKESVPRKNYPDTVLVEMTPTQPKQEDHLSQKWSRHITKYQLWHRLKFGRHFKMLRQTIRPLEIGRVICEGMWQPGGKGKVRSREP